MRSLYISATGMKAQQINQDVIANNLANINTTGFKRGRADFEDLLYQALRPVGASVTSSIQVPTGIYLGQGSRPVSTSKIFTQGASVNTEQWSDISIEGEGFFQIELPDGTTAYTRAGAFQLNSDGEITTPNGDPMEPSITIAQNAIHDTINVGQDGTITFRVGGTTATVTTAGQIQLASFINPAGLEAIGSNYFVESEASGTPIIGTPGEDGLGKTVGGFLERSNVDMVSELVNMIVGQRAYEVNSKGIRVADEMLDTAANIRR